MFRGGRDWPVACNEIPNLMVAPTPGRGAPTRYCALVALRLFIHGQRDVAERWTAQ
jgi:hypothetical protein